MAIRLFAVMAFLATAVLWPINAFYRTKKPPTKISAFEDFPVHYATQNPMSVDFLSATDDYNAHGHVPRDLSSEKTFLWAYVVFTYLFVALTLYSVNWETVRVIRFRQDYLGTQSTITDRTFRLTGIPTDLRSEDRIRHLIEKLDIGRVDYVTLCRDWKKLDGLMESRNTLLRNLETAWAAYLNSSRSQDKHNGSTGNSTTNTSQASAAINSRQADEEAGENGRLLESRADQEHITEGERPQLTIR
jgi:hypothetical protein